jgi:hypothetical protein
MTKARYRPFDRSKMRDWREREPHPRTPAQEFATARNFRIMRLRGLWFLCGVMSPPNALAARALIDADLKALGARTTKEQNDLVLSHYNAEEDL